MRSGSFRTPLLLSATLALAACNHSDVTGPSYDYVHILVVNDSSTSIWVPVFANAPERPLASGEVGELFFVKPESWGGGFAVARPLAHNVATVEFMFARPPAAKAGYNTVTVHVKANPSEPVTARSDRPDLVSITNVTPQ